MASHGWFSLSASCTIARETELEVSQNGVAGVGLPSGRGESYTLSYTGKCKVLLAFSLYGVGNVGFFRKLFFRRDRGNVAQQPAYFPKRF